MTAYLRSIIYSLLFAIPIYSARAQENVILDSYTCADFLKDTKEPADGARLLRSLMMISWATGYAAAYQAGPPRADARAVRLIAATLGDACRKEPKKTVVQTIVNAISHFTSIEQPSKAPTLSTAQNSGQSRWDQDGSTVYLVADGAVRRFYYETPRDDLAAAGAQKGALLFDGKKNGSKYAGTAYAFAAACKPKGYQVNGNISDDEKQVTLRGKAPQLNSRCQVTGYRDDVLVFNFQLSDGN